MKIHPPYLLITVMTVSIVFVTFVSIWFLYSAAVKQQTKRLVEVAQSQARLIETMKEYASVNLRDTSGDTSAQIALAQLVQSHAKFEGFGETGEFTLGKIDGDKIIFLLNHRHYDIDVLKPVPLNSTLAEPMRRALQQLSGTTVALDYRGESVLAAHEPVVGTGWGIVAKIDLTEVRAPFIKAGAYSALSAVLMIFLGSRIFLRITQPIIQKIKNSELEYRRLFDTSEKKFKTLFSASKDAMMIFEDNKIIECNNASLTMFGCEKREDIIGQHPTNISPSFQLNGMPSHILAKERISVAYEQGSNFFEWQHQKLNGKVFHAEVLLTAIDLGNRNVLQATIRDITERKLVEAKLEHQKNELEASNKELESYSYSIAHDLRSPLRAITSFSQILKADIQNQLNEEQLECLNRIIAAGKNMGNLIDDILELSRITRRDINYGEVNLSQLAESTINNLNQAYPGRNVSWKIKDNIEANGDSDLLSIAIQNLLENAWKFTSNKNPAKIEMGKKNTGKNTVYYVKDNGVGFEVEYASNLFKPFYRFHTQEFEGTGIGLATVYRIIHRHGGRIWAEAKKDEGATFYFTLGALAENNNNISSINNYSSTLNKFTKQPINIESSIG